MPEPFTLDLSCQTCGRPLRVELDEPDSPADDVPQVWTCPWCAHEHRARLGGTVRRVTARPERPRPR